MGLEASSHGLAQHRLDGVRVLSAAFTNLTRDHLDYHGEIEKYLASKVRLFSEILSDGGTMVINADSSEASALRAIANQRCLKVIEYGRDAEDIILLERTAESSGQRLKLEVFGVLHQLCLPLPGEFQVANALAALGLAISTDVSVEAGLAALSSLRGVRGRMELAATHPLGAAIYIDYAHTPGALRTVLTGLRQHLTGDLHLVFGCGGERDPGKRVEMGCLANSLADHVIITNDNPRTEDPAAIRGALLAGCPSAREIDDRAEAIFTAVSELKPNDILIVAGKGHESTQIVGNKILPFDDTDMVRKAVQEIVV